MRMTKQEWEKLTQEEQLKLIEKLEEEKESADKALEQFLKKGSKRLDNEKWVSLDGYEGQTIALRVSDIEYIQTICNSKVLVHTNIICDGKKLVLECAEDPYKFVEKMNGNS